MSGDWECCEGGKEGETRDGVRKGDEGKKGGWVILSNVSVILSLRIMSKR